MAQTGLLIAYGFYIGPNGTDRYLKETVMIYSRTANECKTYTFESAWLAGRWDLMSKIVAHQESHAARVAMLASADGATIAIYKRLHRGGTFHA